MALRYRLATPSNSHHLGFASVGGGGPTPEYIPLSILSEKVDESVLRISKEAVAVIHNSTNAPPTVALHKLHSDGSETQAIPHASGYAFYTEGAVNRQMSLEFRRHVSDNVAGFEKLCAFLERVKVNGHRGSRSKRRCSVHIAREAFVSVRGCLKTQKENQPVDLYSRVQFRYLNNFSSTQYFKTRCSTLKPAMLNSATQVDRFRSIDINTGMCMFSRPSLKMSPGHDELDLGEESFTIPPLPHDIEPTMYELELIVRLSSSIADVVALVDEHCSQSHAIINVNLDIPDFQYYWATCKLLERKLITIEYVTKWIAAMDKRRHQLAAVMTDMVYYNLSSRSISMSKVQVRLTRGTEAAADLIKETVKSGLLPSLDEVVSALRSGKEGLQWSQFLDSFDRQSRLATVGDLGKVTYVYNMVKSALLSTSPAIPQSGHPERAGRALIFHVDDIHESTIFDRSKNFLPRYGRKHGTGAGDAVIIGLFPMQKIFVAGPGRSYLYHDGPTANCVRADASWDDPKQRVGVMDVMGEIYGKDVAQRLGHALLSEGLSK